MAKHKIAPRLSRLIGWNCIQRRNIGYVYAKKNGAKFIASVDDDNIPYLKIEGKKILAIIKKYKFKNL